MAFPHLLQFFMGVLMRVNWASHSIQWVLSNFLTSFMSKVSGRKTASWSRNRFLLTNSGDIRTEAPAPGALPGAKDLEEDKAMLVGLVARIGMIAEAPRLSD